MDNTVILQTRVHMGLAATVITDDLKRMCESGEIRSYRLDTDLRQPPQCVLEFTVEEEKFDAALAKINHYASTSV